MTSRLRKGIELFYLPEESDNLSLNIKVDSSNYGDIFNEKDRRFTESFWGVISEEAKRYGRPLPTTCKILATLHSVDLRNLVFKTTEFKDYVAITRNFERFADEARNGMRVAAVAAYLLSAEDSILVHRRSTKSTHSPGYLDGSCVGLCATTKNGKSLDPKRDLAKKLEEELGLTMELIKETSFSGLHSYGAPGFSSTFTYGLTTNLGQEDISKRVDEAMKKSGVGRLSSYEFVNRKKLADYLIKHFIGRKDMAGEGLMALMGALDKSEFDYVMDRIKRSGFSVQKGRLSEGKFLKND